MTVTNENDSTHVEKPSSELADEAGESPAAEGEFKITVRKLEMPVRPRGVLAE